MNGDAVHKLVISARANLRRCGLLANYRNAKPGDDDEAPLEPSTLAELSQHIPVAGRLLVTPVKVQGTGDFLFNVNKTNGIHVSKYKKQNNKDISVFLLHNPTCEKKLSSWKGTWNFESEITGLNSDSNTWKLGVLPSMSL